MISINNPALYLDSNGDTIPLILGDDYSGVNIAVVLKENQTILRNLVEITFMDIQVIRFVERILINILPADAVVYVAGEIPEFVIGLIERLGNKITYLGRRENKNNQY